MERSSAPPRLTWPSTGWRGSSAWGDAAALVGLYAAAAAVNLVSVWAVSRSLVLMGEEMSVSIRDVLFSVEQHAQASVWSTNFGAPVYYWAASHLDPSYSLFSARRWKAAAMALLAPLVYLVTRRRLGCGRGAAVVGGVVVALLPGIMMFGWLATENGLEAVAGAVGLYVATSRRRWWPAAPLFGGVAVTTYPSGVAWAVVIVAVCAWRAARPDPERWRRVARVGAALAAAAMVVVFPRLWWTVGPRRLIAGGGTFEGDPLGHLADLARQLGVSGASYYFFGDQPALGSSVLAAAVLVCAVALRRRSELWPWLAVAGVTVALWVPAGHVPGVRRAVAVSVVAALVLAVAVDSVSRWAAWRAGGASVVGVTVAAMVLPLVWAAASWQWSYASGARALIADFPIPGGPMPATFAAWEAGLRSGELTVGEMAAEHDGLRTLAVVWMLADRQGRDTSGLPSPARIVAETVPGAAPRG